MNNAKAMLAMSVIAGALGGGFGRLSCRGTHRSPKRVQMSKNYADARRLGWVEAKAGRDLEIPSGLTIAEQNHWIQGWHSAREAA